MMRDRNRRLAVIILLAGGKKRLMKHSKRFLACDDINLTDHLNATRFMPFFDNIKEKHGYTCSPVIKYLLQIFILYFNHHVITYESSAVLIV